MTRLLAIACLCACGDPYGIPYDTDLRPFQKQAVTITHLMAHEWVHRHEADDDELHGAIEDTGIPEIRWVTTPCPYDERFPTAVVYRDECLHGLVIGFRPRVYLAERQSMAASSLETEMGHYYRIAVYGDGDLGHTDPDWWAYWWGPVHDVIRRQEEAWRER